MSTVRYAIKGTNDSAAIDQAKQGLLGLGDGVNKLNGLFKAFVGLKVIQGLGKAAGDTMAAFSVQQNAVAQLTNSIKNNANLGADSLKRLTSYASGLQKKGIYGDEELLKQASYLTSLGLTEDKIKGVLDASVNLAASGVMPLDAAVKNMAKQFGGMAGELGEKIPALRTLTAEQLKAGEGIALVQRQFAGALETAASTLEGKTQQAVNVVGDIKEKIGAVFGEVFSSVLSFAQPLLEEFDAWLDIAKDKVINLLRYFPEILPEIGKILATIGENLVNPDYLLAVLSELGKYLWNVIKITFTNIGPLIVEAFKEMWNSIAYLQYRLAKFFDLMGAQLSDVFLSVAESFVNAIIDGINKAITVLNDIPLLNLNIGTLGGADFNTGKAKALEGTTADFKTWKGADWSGALKPNPDVDIGKSLSKYFTESAANLGSLAKGLVDPLVQGTEGPLARIAEILNRQREEAPQVARDAAVAAAEATAAIPDLQYEGTMVGAGSGGSTDTGISAYVPPGGIGDIIGSLMKSFGPLVSSFASFKALLNPLSTIIEGMMEVLGPLIDSLLKPLVGILKIVGQTIGKMLAPALQLLEPIITAISKLFVWLFNKVVVPIYNAIQGVFNLILNGFIAFANGILAIIDAIPFVNVGRISYRAADAGFLDTISLDDVNAAGATGTAGSSGGSSASYSGAKDVTVNIYYSNSYVNGDAREIALNIRNEIRLAEGVGL